MPYATVDDVAARLGKEITDTAEIAQVNAYITDVSAWVDDFCRGSVPNPVPASVTSVVCAEVIRLMNTVPGISAETVGDVTTNYQSSALGLTNGSKEVLKKYRPTFHSYKLQTSFDIERPCLP